MSTEDTKLNNESSSLTKKAVSKKELNDLQNILSQAMENYKKNGGKRTMITFYDQSGSSRRVNTKKKITTIKKRRFIPYRMEIQDLDEILARKRKGKLSDNRDTQYDDDGYDTDQYTQYSEASSIDNSSQYRNNNEEEEEDQQSFQPRTLREKMNAVQELLAKMEGNLDDIEDYEFSED